MGVSLFSAAATKVSMFKAEPNPVRECISKITIKNEDLWHSEEIENYL